MGVGFECSSTQLLCPEDSNSVLGFDDEECATGEVGVENDQNGVFRGNLLVDFPLQSDECLALLVFKESDHMPKDDYLMRLQSGAVDLSVRREAIDWIWKVGLRYPFVLLSVMSFFAAVTATRRTVIWAIVT